MKAMILAAGRGERMRPLTDSTPKPLLTVGGKPLIGYHLEALARAGLRDVVVNLSWLGGSIRQAIGTGERYGVRIAYSDEGANALETAGGIFKALPLLAPGPFLVVNGDIWTDIDLGKLHLEDAADGRLVLVSNPVQHPRGDFGLDGDSVVERDTDRFTYSGVGMFRPELFAGCQPGKFPLLPLLKRAIAAGKLRGQLHRGEWNDVGTPERLAELERRLAGELNRAPAASARTMVFHERSEKDSGHH
jgi:MurNAc alpha-1-phosphate uridylyltransferase